MLIPQDSKEDTRKFGKSDVEVVFARCEKLVGIVWVEFGGKKVNERKRSILPLHTKPMPCAVKLVFRWAHILRSQSVIASDMQYREVSAKTRKHVVSAFTTLIYSMRLVGGT